MTPEEKNTEQTSEGQTNEGAFISSLKRNHKQKVHKLFTEELSKIWN